jgi:hypothetical protein
MKEQILVLEATDDLHSLRDKIARAQADRLVLLWPVLAKPVSRRLDLVLMTRWAAAAGSELAVVSADESVRRLARAAGVPSYPNLTASALAGLSPRPPAGERLPSLSAGRHPPPGPPPEGRRRPLPPVLRIGFFCAAVLSIASVFLLLLPSARLRVVFPSRKLEAAAAVESSLCAELYLQLSLSERRATGGRILAPTAYARGELRLTNISSRVLTLPAGIRAASDGGILFETVAGTILAPGQSQLSAVRAVEPGPSANLPAGSITRVPGPLALSLTAENPEPISGGSEAWRSAVSAADVESLRGLLSAQAQQEAAAGLQNLAGEGRLVVAESLRLEFDPQDAPDLPVNTPADSVGLTLHASATMKACPIDAVRARAADLLGAQLMPDEILFPEAPALRLMENADGGIDLAASGTAVKTPGRNEWSLALRARTPAQAVSLLKSRFHAVEVPAVDCFPDWLPALPLFPFQIEIVVEAE